MSKFKYTMALDFVDVIDFISNLISLGGTSSSNHHYDDQPEKNKKIKYLTEKASAAFVVAASVLLFFVFKDPLPPENYSQTLIIASLIGIAVSGILFFILYIAELYYFKSLFRLLLFSGSVILFFISLVLCIYFKSGLFV
ncbi:MULTISPECIES: branched-chain amino acid ABC transporter substrate-binding protein [Chryseobacterium]|uniref:branched-chain amino acid ABC transporter substrate-binding protein n=1 Tax=Chryseobacterium TaxID=59732 RepID=UPI001E4D25FC|nr:MULTISPECIES: branched-chain amino acid ABC transporter substrate-binding protein [Chryseobacterium]MDR6920553.1 putative MAPEG superfamily protein [Chryseobacterium sp. 2987]